MFIGFLKVISSKNLFFSKVLLVVHYRHSNKRKEISNVEKHIFV